MINLISRTYWLNLIQVGELQKNLIGGEAKLLKINSKEFLEGYRFILVGICSVSIDFIFYYLFIYLNLFDPNTSKKISFIIGALFAFYANRNYVFHVSEKKKSHFILFCLLYLVSFILNALVHDYVYSICYGNIYYCKLFRSKICDI